MVKQKKSSQNNAIRNIIALNLTAFIVAMSLLSGVIVWCFMNQELIESRLENSFYVIDASFDDYCSLNNKSLLQVAEQDLVNIANGQPGIDDAKITDDGDTRMFQVGYTDTKVGSAWVEKSYNLDECSTAN